MIKYAYGVLSRSLKPLVSCPHGALLSAHGSHTADVHEHETGGWKALGRTLFFIAAWRILIIHKAVFFHHETLYLGCGFYWDAGLSHAFDSQWLILWGVIISLTFILEAWACLSGWQWAIRSYSITDRQFNLLYPNPFVLLLSFSRWPLQ